MRGALNSVYTSIWAAPKASTLSAPPAGQTWKSYYYAGNQLIALRVEGDPVPSKNGVYYLHTDHLGSTSLTTCGNTSGCAGTPLGGEMPGTRQNYYPFGQIRTPGTNLLTDKGFTGQRLDDTGLMFYNARYYSPLVGRFVSADTIVPEPGNPQSLNRFSYVRNNPLKYVDPTGHKEDLGCETQGCDLPLDEELQAKSNATQLIHDENFKRKAEFYARCAQGGGAECQTLHEAENILKGLGLAFVVPTAGMGVAKGAEWISWQLLKGCLYSPLCARLIGAGVTGAAGAKATNSAEIPTGYSAEEWAIRQQVVEREGGIFKCAFCAKAMSRQTGDAVVTLTTDEGALLGPGGSNIGAPAGWHTMTIDQLGNAWDNFGFQGNAGDFLGRLLGANPSGVNVSVFSIFDDAWAWLTGGY